jgi:hypothetical protein
LDDLDGCKKPLRDRRKDDLDDLDYLLSRRLSTPTMALRAPLAGQLPSSSAHPVAIREMVVLVVQVVHPHVKSAKLAVLHEALT